jgi:hypothetical protein
VEKFEMLIFRLALATVLVALAEHDTPLSTLLLVEHTPADLN